MEKVPTSDHQFISRLTDIIYANLDDENFGVIELAGKAGISLKILRKKLGRITKKTVNQFIRDTRLRKALEMLQDGSFTVSEVAYKTGFHSPVYFIKCFHELFGFPPGKVRKGDLSQKELISLTRDMNAEVIAKALRRKRIIAFPGSLLFVIILGATAFVLIRRWHNQAKIEDLVSPDGRISIAVMPFQNLTNDTIWNIWQTGIQDELISSLSNSKELKLEQSEQISSMLKSQRMSDFASLTPAAAGRISKKLDAGAFLIGRILKSGSDMRVDAHLIDTKTSEVFKSFQIEKPCREEFVFQIIDTLSIQIRSFLITTVLGKELRPEDRPVTRSPEAYRYYAKGLDAFHNRDFSQAVEFYKLALGIDSNLTTAASDLSFAYSYLGMEDQSRRWCLWLYNRMDSMTYLDKLWVKWVYASRFQSPYESINCLEQLQEYDESGPNFHFLIGSEYLGSGDYKQAVNEFRTNFEILRKRDPDLLLDWDYVGLGSAYHKAGMYREEEKLYRKASRFFPQSTELLFREAVLSTAEDDTTRARRYIDRFKFLLRNKAVPHADILARVAAIYSEGNDTDKAEKCYREALMLEPGSPDRLNDLAYFLIDKELKINEGLTLADSALRLKPDYYSFLYTRGWGLYKQGKVREALEVLQKSWDLRMKFSSYDYQAFMRLEEVKKSAGTAFIIR